MDAIGNKKRLIKTFIVAFVAVATIALIATATIFTLPATQADDLTRAEAATQISSSNKSTLTKATSGDYILTEDITLNNNVSESPFKGTLDGNGHTITISGTFSKSYGTASSQKDHYLGCLFGTIDGGTIKNVKIKFTGSYALSATNSREGQETACTTIFAGIVCGVAQNNATFENVELEITGKFAVIGIDGAQSGEDDDGWFTSDYSLYNKYAAGQGSVVGGLIGRSQGATIKNIVLNNSGSIYARAENQDAGHKSKKSGVVDCSSPTRGDRANAGGLIGETATSTTTVTSLTVSGGGIVGAYTSGLRTNGNYCSKDASHSHNINAAGLILGATYDDKGVFNCSGLWFKATGKAYVAQTSSSGTFAAGVIVGRTNVNPIISNLWRNANTDSNPGSTDGSNGAQRGINTYNSTTEAPATDNISLGEGASSVGSNILGVARGIGNITSSSVHEYTPIQYITWGGSSSSTGDYGTATIVGLKNNKLDIEVSSKSSYYISALSYKKNGKFGNYTNIYEKEFTQSHTFTAGADVACEEFRVHVATKSYNITTSFSGTTKVDDVHVKTFNNAGIEFNGSPATGININSNFVWRAINQETKAVYDGTYGNNTVTTGVDAGTYIIALYKKGADGEPVRATAGDIVATNEKDGPSIIYCYETAEYTCKINPATLDFTKGTAILTKVYDGTTSIGNLERGKHYFLKDKDGKDPITEPEYTYDTQNSKYASSDAGENITITVVDFNLTGNYQLDGGKQNFDLVGKITPRTIGLDWANTSLTYNGSVQKPSATPNNLLEGDNASEISVIIATYASMGDAMNLTNPVDAKNVGTYVALATIGLSTDSTLGKNYTLAKTQDVLFASFTISQKQITLAWEKFTDTTFNNKAKAVGVNITAGSICGSDDVPLTVTYKQGSQTIESGAIWHAWKENSDYYYDAVASINNPNYVIAEGYSNYSARPGYDVIKLDPWTIDVKYYTGTSDKVEQLVYAGIDYKQQDGLHVKLATEGTGLVDANLELSYGATQNIISVGTYKVTVSLVKSMESDNAVLSDYVIAEDKLSQIIEVISRKITIAFNNASDGKVTYTYDCAEKSVTPYVASGAVSGETVQLTYSLYSDPDCTNILRSKYVTDAGNYYAKATVSGNNNYTGSAQVALVISQYSFETADDTFITVDDIPNAGYTGAEIKPTVTVKDSRTKDMSRKDGLLAGFDYVVTYSDNINVNENSTTKATVTIEGIGNYTGRILKKFVIEPGTLGVTYIGAKDTDQNPTVFDFIYNGTDRYNGITYGESQSGILVSFTGCVQGEGAPQCKVVYKKIVDGEKIAMDDVPTTVGTYEAEVQLVGKIVNYKLPSPVPTQTFTIAPKPIHIQFKAEDVGGYVYNGNEQGVTVEFIDEAEICTVDQGFLALSLKYEQAGTIVTPKRAGKYTAIASLTGSNEVAQNYVIENHASDASKQNPYNFDIASKTVKVVFGDNTTVYNRTPQFITCEWVAGEIMGGDVANISVTYTLNGTAADNPTDCGIYVATAYCSSNDYTIDTASNSTQFVITPAELTVTGINFVNNSSYYYIGKARTVSYTLNGVIYGDENDVNIIATYTKYTDETRNEGEVVEECKNAGIYGVRLSLSEEATNYTLNLDEYQANHTNANGQIEFGFVINKRQLVIAFSGTGNVTYSASDNEAKTIVYAATNGRLNSDGNGNTSGVPDGDSSFTLGVEIYNEQGELVKSARNVGTYTVKATIDSENYVLNDDGGAHKLETELIVNKKSISFEAKENVVKTYGDFDPDLTQAVKGCGDEIINVTLMREDGENAGKYKYTGFAISDQSADVASNYAISLLDAQGDAQYFVIVKREVEFEPKVFSIDYEDDIPALTQEVVVLTNKFGSQTITITFERAQNNTDVGNYDLKAEFTQDNDNYTFIMEEGANKGKFIIYGKAVKIVLDPLKLQKTFGEADPTLYEAIISLDVEKASEWLSTDYKKYCLENGSAEGFNWGDYLSLKREDADDEHYREQGYALTLTFNNKDANGNIYNNDKNFRAVFVDSEGKECVYVFMINKKVLEYDQIKPGIATEQQAGVTISKTYDGDSKASVTIDNDMYSNYYSAAGINVVAMYQDAQAGTGKNMYIKFEILDQYANDYIITKDGETVDFEEQILYTTEGVIAKRTLTATMASTDDINLTYGETPTVNVKYDGFIQGQNAISEGISVIAQYSDDVALDVIRDATTHYIVLFEEKCDTPNYTVECSGTIKVNISERSLSVVATGVEFVKPVDNSDVANITKDHYKFEGLLESDKGAVDIEISSQKLTSKAVGTCNVNVVINKLTGSKAGNYKLVNTTFSVSARIQKLADVTLSDKKCDYDGTSQKIEPVVTNKLDNVGYRVTYRGLTYAYCDDNGNGIETPPTNAGTYEVVCYVYLYETDVNGNTVKKYEVEMGNARLTINRITPTISFEGLLKQVYGSFTPVNAIATSSVGLNEALDVRYSFANDNGTLPAFPPAGTHSITAVCEESQNYNRAYLIQNLVIKEREITVTISDYTGLVYNGYDRKSDIKVTFNGVVEGDSCKPVKSFSSSSVKDAGSYTLTVTPDNSSYKIKGSTSVHFTIAKKTLYVSANETTAELGTKPEFTLSYDGFVENEDVEDLTVEPSVKLSANQIGENAVQYNQGSAKNYEFVYLDSTYTITYKATVDEDEKNITPYIVALCIVGGIGLIVALAFISRSITLRSVYNAGYSRKAIRKEVFDDDKKNKRK